MTIPRTGRLEARRDAFARLSVAFSYPDEEAARSILSGQLLGGLLAEYAQDQPPPPRSPSCRLGPGTGSDSREDEREIIALQVEFTRLFVTSAGARLPAPPHESFYASSAGLLMDSDTISSLRRFHDDAGLTMTSDSSGASPDHLSVELEVMSHLIDEEVRAAALDDIPARGAAVELQRRFMKEHLSTWTPAFLSRVRKASRSSFYSGAAARAARFLEEQTVLLGAGPWRAVG